MTRLPQPWSSLCLYSPSLPQPGPPRITSMTATEQTVNGQLSALSLPDLPAALEPVRQPIWEALQASGTCGLLPALLTAVPAQSPLLVSSCPPRPSHHGALGLRLRTLLHTQDSPGTSLPLCARDCSPNRPPNSGLSCPPLIHASTELAHGCLKVNVFKPSFCCPSSSPAPLYPPEPSHSR